MDQKEYKLTRQEKITALKETAAIILAILLIGALTAITIFSFIEA